MKCVFLTDPDVPFSPERSCPNEGFGDGQDCEEPWNPYVSAEQCPPPPHTHTHHTHGHKHTQQANNLLFHDFGDFPILALDRDQFQTMLSVS